MRPNISMVLRLGAQWFELICQDNYVDGFKQDSFLDPKITYWKQKGCKGEFKVITINRADICTAVVVN